MLEIIRNNPFVRLVIPFIIGILFANRFLCSNTYIYIILFSLLLFWLLLNWMNDFLLKRKIQSLFLLGIFFMLGYSRVGEQHYEPPPFFTSSTFFAQLLDYPDTTSRSAKLNVDLIYEITDTGLVKMRSKAYLRTPNNDQLQTLEPGNVLLVHAKPLRIQNQDNPGAFDFQLYAKTQGFYYQLYASENHWKKIEQKHNIPMGAYLKRLRRYIFEYYSQSGLSNDELNVFTALTLGDKSLLEHDLRQGYVSAGLMHVLAVSGLHVGIIYAVLKYLLAVFAKKRWGKILRFFLSILVLWGYAMFTGLSPSVTRAATMFSVFVLGDLFGKRYAVYNSMALAAFILLFYNPLLLQNVGFQMSFLAVAGIVFFYPHIYKWLYFSKKIPDKIWQLMAVSIAAQLITTPLSLYYFHQFPLFFLLSNLLMVPLATILMYVFVVLLLFMPFPLLAQKIGWVANKLTSIMNWFTSFIHQLEWATISDVQVNTVQLILLYALIVFITIWGLRTNYRYLKYIFFATILLVVSYTYQEIRQNLRNSLVVFNTYQKPLIVYSAGKQNIILNAQNMDNPNYYLQPYFLAQGLNKNNHENKIESDIHIFGHPPFNGIFYNVDFYPQQDTIKCRWLILSKDSPYNIGELLRMIVPEIIIADPSVPIYKLSSWRRSLLNQPIYFYSISEQGAYIEEWTPF